MLAAAVRPARARLTALCRRHWKHCSRLLMQHLVWSQPAEQQALTGLATEMATAECTLVAVMEVVRRLLALMCVRRSPRCGLVLLPMPRRPLPPRHQATVLGLEV